MKTKPIAYIIVLLILGLFFLNFTKGQQISKKYLTVRTVEYFTGGGDAKIVIINETGKIEEVELGKYRGAGLGENGMKINSVLNNISNKGYELHSASSCGGDGSISQIFIFSK